MTVDTLTFNDTFVYSATAGGAEVRPRGITVVFFATRAPSGLDLGDQLKEHFKQVAESEELWLVAPQNLETDLIALDASADLRDRLRKASALSSVRCVTFDGAGKWNQVHTRGSSELTVATAQRGLQSAGLQALFSACRALLTAHAGLHFGKPSGKHSTHFLRGGAVAERSVHAHFVAMTLLGWAANWDYDRVWVDTAAISSIAYALNELRQALSSRPPAVVDSFGGYDGLDQASFTYPGLALISASTSGGLSSELEARGVIPGRQRTLFFVGNQRPDETVLCDITARGEDALHGLVPPFPTWPDSATCELCRNGQNVVVLQGDSFAPTPGLATPLQLKGDFSDDAHRAFIREFLGKGVVTLRHSDGTRASTVRSLSFQFRELVTTDAETRRLVADKLEKFLPLRTRFLVHLDDPESHAIAALAKELCDARGLADVELIAASALEARASLTGGVSVIVAGIVATGREMLNISRKLRSLIAGGGDLAYFVGCARPASLQAWKDLRINLVFKADGTRYLLDNLWYAQAEPYSVATDPWLAEDRMLSALESWLGDNIPGDPALAAVEARRDVLSKPLGDFAGFVPSDLGAPEPQVALRLNPNFALWDDDLDVTAATHAEVYFTMSTVLHRSRHSTDGRYSLFEQPGFGHVLAPTNFDRFNDPIIQSALLRGARGTELRFVELPEQSARMAEVIATAITEWADGERGGAALEFALSLLRGIREDTGGAIRLDERGYEVVRDAARSLDPTQTPVLSRTIQLVDVGRSNGE